MKIWQFAGIVIAVAVIAISLALLSWLCHHAGQRAVERGGRA